MLAPCSLQKKADRFNPMKLIFLTLLGFLTSEAAKFVHLPSHLVDPFDDGQNHDVDTDENYFEEEEDDDDEDLSLAQGATAVTEEEEDSEDDDSFDNETADEPLDLAEGESEEENDEDPEENDVSLLHEGAEDEDDIDEYDESDIEADDDETDSAEDRVPSFLQLEEVDDDKTAEPLEDVADAVKMNSHDDATQDEDAEVDASETTDMPSTEAAFIQEDDKASHDDATQDEDAEVDASETTDMPSTEAAFIQEDDKASHDASQDEDAEVDASETTDMPSTEAAFIQEDDKASHDDATLDEDAEVDVSETTDMPSTEAAFIQEDDKASHDDATQDEDAEVDASETTDMPSTEAALIQEDDKASHDDATQDEDAEVDVSETTDMPSTEAAFIQEDDKASHDDATLDEDAEVDASETTDMPSTEAAFIQADDKASHDDATQDEDAEVDASETTDMPSTEAAFIQEDDKASHDDATQDEDAEVDASETTDMPSTEAAFIQADDKASHDDASQDEDAEVDASETTDMPSTEAAFIQEDDKASHDASQDEDAEVDASETTDMPSTEAAFIQEDDKASHDDATLDEDAEVDASETTDMPSTEAAFIQADDKASHDDATLDEDAEVDASETTDMPSTEAAFIQADDKASHDDATQDEDAEVDVSETTDMPSTDSAFIQEDEEADIEDAEESEDVDPEGNDEEYEPVDGLGEENLVQESASLVQEGEELQNIPPERQYVGSLKDPKAHPYVYKSRGDAHKACQALGYRGLCSASQVRGWSKCAWGWMADYKGYWFKKTRRGCGRGKGFRNGKNVKKMGAYCCNLASNSQYIGSLARPDAHPYVYNTRSSAEKACRRAGYRGLCAKSQVEGYAKCAAGWMSNWKGYWMDRSKRGCGKGRGFRGWGKGKVGAYCCAPTVNNIQYIGSLTDTKAHPYVYRTRKAAKKACRAAGYHGLCSKSQGTGYSRCAAGWYSNYKGYWMHGTVKGCGKGRGWRGWGRGKVGAYCCNLASNTKFIGSLKNPKKRYVYKSKISAAQACHKAGYRRLCRKFEIKGYAKCAGGWLADYKGYWFDRKKRGCGRIGLGYRGWGKGKVGAYCCGKKDNVKYVGNLRKPKSNPYVYSKRKYAESACRKSGYRRLCYRSEIEFVNKCKAGWMKDSKGYWFGRTKKGCGKGRGYRGWGKGKVGAYCCEKLDLPLCHTDQLSASKGVWRCDQYSGKKGRKREQACTEKYQQILVNGKTMNFKCVASNAGGGRFNCLAGDKCQTIFPRG